MTHWAEAVLAIVLVALFTFIGAIESTLNSTIRNCERMGMFMHGDVVVKCEVTK